ncbi:hypothetical protein H2277_06370, partial [Campylobacter sp. W0014]|nr:hypothetical protein [Campylobacter sp. W0014]
MKNKNLSKKTKKIKSQSISKKFLFSLATVSVLSTCADAKINGGGCNDTTCGTVSSTQNTAITVSDKDNVKLTIESGGSVITNGTSVTFNNNSSLQNFDNQGTIQNNSSQEAIKFHGATIDNFKNSGLISGSWSGLEINSGTNHIKTFENSGTIQSTGKNTNGILLKNGTIDNFTNEKNGLISGKGDGILFENSTIKTLTNSGTIEGKGVGLKLFNNASNNTIDTLKNTGTIKGGAEGINMSKITITDFSNDGVIQSENWSGVVLYEQSTIENFTNKGTIESKIKDNDKIGLAGLYIQKSHIKTFTNEGIISGNNGVSLFAGTVDSFINKGTIIGTSSYKNTAALSLQNLEEDGQSLVKTFTNEGLLKSESNGIAIESGSKIETLNNKGTIEAKLNGLSFYIAPPAGDLIEVGQINLESSSVIKAGNDGLHIDGSDKDIKVKGIDVKSGALLQGAR